MDINTPVPTIYGDSYDKHIELWKKQVAGLRERFGDKVEEVLMPREYPTDTPIVFVKASAICEVLEFVKTTADFEYGYLSDLTATDEQEEPRFHVVYNLLSRKTMARLRLKVRVPKEMLFPPPSVFGLRPTGPSAKSGTCLAFGSKDTRISAASSWMFAGRATRCARTTRFAGISSSRRRSRSIRRCSVDSD